MPRTQPTPPQVELTTGQLIGRTFLFLLVVGGFFKGAIYIGDMLY